jgi:predicted AlkP superfamily pyrophosphatase or phosphodiesterase
LRRFAALIPLLGASLILPTTGCGSPSAAAPTLPTLPTPAPTPTPSPKVAILSVDGLRGDAPTQTPTPNIYALTRRGAYTWKAQTVFPSMTLPAHTSMLSGFLPTDHHILWDVYDPTKPNCTVPTIFGIAHAAGLRTVLVAGKEKFRHLEVNGTIDEFLLIGGDVEIANQAIVQSQAGFDLMFVHFPDVDIVGHARGWMSGDYLHQLEVADGAIGRLLSALPPETTIILTADHGGRGTIHGSEKPEDMTIPWVVAGPRIPGRGRELTKPVRTVDTAATALFVLGLSPAKSATGVVVSEAFSAE